MGVTFRLIEGASLVWSCGGDFHAHREGLTCLVMWGGDFQAHREGSTCLVMSLDLWGEEWNCLFLEKES